MSSLLKIALFFFAFAAVARVNAQTISGKVIDETGAAVPGCNVYLEGTFYGTSTNANGDFSFQAEAEDSAVFVVEFLGFEDYRNVVEAGRDVEINVTLKEAFDKLNAVTVSAGAYGTGDND